MSDATLVVPPPEAVGVPSPETRGLAPSLFGHVLVGASGYLLLGLAAAVGAPREVGFLLGQVVLGVAAIPVVATLPSLLVGAQALGIPTPPATLARDVVHGVAEGGRLALALAPVAVFFSLTSERWGLIVVLAAAGAVLRGLAFGRRAVPGILGVAWAVLSALLSIRLAFLVSGVLAG